MKKILFLITCHLFLICIFGQQKTYIIDKNLNQVVNKFSDYKNDFGSLDVMAGTDNEIVTTYKIKHEDYFNSTGGRYLKLAYSNRPSSSSLVDSDWDIIFRKTNDDKVECTITLKKIMPSMPARSNSTGKLEKEITDFLQDEIMNGEERTSVEVFEVNDSSQQKNIPNFQPFRTLLNEKKVISLPNTLTNFIDKLGSNPIILSNEACENNEYYSWNFSNEVNLIYFRLKNQNQAYSLSYFGDNVIEGLPLGLSFRQTTFQSCKAKYAKYSAKWHQETEEDPNTNTSRAYTVLEFRMESYFVTLGFYDNEHLSSIQLSTSK
jgi:hypothetical protein